mmetsp:Transcript_3723/g.12510  ORF Transcript_3723/g.12510 Transcript_3723/m.12510 type:complete len:253 (+) Transcript_3723:838-1596(+)
MVQPAPLGGALLLRRRRVGGGPQAGRRRRGQASRGAAGRPFPRRAAGRTAACRRRRLGRLLRCPLLARACSRRRPAPHRRPGRLVQRRRGRAVRAAADGGRTGAARALPRRCVAQLRPAVWTRHPRAAPPAAAAGRQVLLRRLPLAGAPLPRARRRGGGRCGLPRARRQARPAALPRLPPRRLHRLDRARRGAGHAPPQAARGPLDGTEPPEGPAAGRAPPCLRRRWWAGPRPRRVSEVGGARVAHSERPYS